MPNKPDRETLSESPPTKRDAAQIVRLEAENGLKQYDAAIQIIETAIKAGEPFVLQPFLIKEMNRLAVTALEPTPGEYRQGPISIKNTSHVPPPHHEVPGLVDAMCKHINDSASLPPLEQAAYLLWRINWIHPFTNGNGRTARMVSYIVLSIRLGFLLPGKNTIPEQIAADKSMYYLGLDAADAAWKKSGIDVSNLASLLSALLARQLLTVMEYAEGNSS